MTSYRFARRSFLTAVGGAVGLKVLLRNLESSAQGLPPPPRLLVAFWPLGTIKYFFLPPPNLGLGDSRILEPIAAAGLADNTTVLYGFQTTSIPYRSGGPAELGTVKVMTGAASPGTRINGGETDDAVAGGPSFDQVFLKRVPDLQRPGQGFSNVICDARVDSFETSAQCLSYGYTQRAIPSAIPANGIINENIPLLPTLEPARAYTQLFGGFSGTPMDPNRVRNLLRARKSILDHSLRELARLRTLAPASESVRIDQHEAVIRKLETQLAAQLAGPAGTACQPPGAPDPALVGKSGSKNVVGMPAAPAEDVLHAQIGRLHASILRAAFQCDLIRVATFQWAPASSHVSFGGLYPADPAGAYMHAPLSHRVTNPADTLTAYPAEDRPQRAVVDFLANVHAWYNRETAAIVNDFRNATDVFGGNLLDNTIIPFVTDLAEPTGSPSPLPALIFGGQRLGLVQGQIFDFSAAPRPMNDLWMTIAQALLRTSDPMSALADESFVSANVSPIAGLWRAQP